jgi:hypothetical protein
LKWDPKIILAAHLHLSTVVYTIPSIGKSLFFEESAAREAADHLTQPKFTKTRNGASPQSGNDWKQKIENIRGIRLKEVQQSLTKKIVEAFQ